MTRTEHKTSTATPPKIAVIGAGGWGMNHVRVWHELGSLHVVCDTDNRRLAGLRDRYPDVEMSADLTGVLERRDIEAVVIATPAPTHTDFAIKAIEAGKDVLVEKPMSLTVSGGERVLEAAARAERIVMVGHVLEYHPAVLKLRQLVDDGEFGQIRYMYSNRLNLGRIRTEENALWSFAPHDVAIMLRMLGTMPERTASHGRGYLNPEVADVTLTHLGFPGGVEGYIFVSWLHPFKEHRFVVVGERKMAVLDDTAPWESKLALYAHSVEWVPGQVPVTNRAEAETVPLAQLEPLKVECEAFIGSVVTRRPPLTDGESGLRVLRVLEAAQRSLVSDGKPVALASHDTVAQEHGGSQQKARV